MSRLEDALREALRREEPPAGFTERVMARVGRPVAEPPSGLFARWTAAFRRPALRLAAAGVLAVLVAVGVQHRQRQLRAEAAREQVLIALRLTGAALDSVREQVRNSSSARQVITVSPGIFTSSKEKP
jgi:hypothetical protein